MFVNTQHIWDRPLAVINDEAQHIGKVVSGGRLQDQLDVLSISPRSRLYCLKPVGVDTPYVECLTSYVARLAETHHISPQTLVLKEIYPALGEEVTTPQQYSRLNNFWFRGSYSINGSSSIAKQWVEVLQTLTSCKSLVFLTMLPWSEAIVSDKLIRATRAWCPLCYEEWQRQSQVIYEPLLWGIDGIDICLQHQQPLVNRCPHCQELNSFLAQSSRPGYCSRCACWLGCHNDLQGPASLSSDEPEFKHQLWLGKVVGELFATAPHLSSVPSKEQVAKMLDICLARYARGNMSALSRKLGLDVQIVWGYLRKGVNPTFKNLLHICHTFSIAPLEFLTTSTDHPLKGPQFVLDQLPSLPNTRGHTMSEENIRTYRCVLEQVLALDDVVFPSLSQVVKKLGCRIETFRRHFPDLCQAISVRQPRTWTEDTHAMAKQELENALKSSEPVPLQSVCKRIGWDREVLLRYFPDLCESVVSRYRNRFDHQRYQKRLLEELTKEGPTLSVKELATELGCSHLSLRDWYPDECSQLSERRRVERQKGSQDRIQKELEELEQVMVTLHQQNIYPGVRKVRSLLSDPFWLYRPEGRKKWRENLEKLGYSLKT